MKCRTLASPSFEPGTIFTRLRESGHAARRGVFSAEPARLSLGFPLRRVEIIMVHRAPEESRLSSTTETKRNVSLKEGEERERTNFSNKGKPSLFDQGCDQRQYILLTPEIFGNFLAVSTRSVILTC